MNGRSNAASVTKLALLIDGDNVSATYMPLIIREAEKRGVVAVRRIYGQFKSGKMKSWLKYIDEYDLTTVNVSPLTRGKNATDMKLVIEAMDVLYGRQLDGFCIASSDGDFTPLAVRIRGNAVACYGFGMKKAPAGYKVEFDHFYECDTMLAAEKKRAPRKAAALAPKATAPQRAAPRQQAVPKTAPPARPTRGASGSKRSVPPEIADAIGKIVRGRGGRASFRDIGNAMPRLVPGFKASNYDFGSTKTLIKSLNGKHGLVVKEDHVTLSAA